MIMNINTVPIYINISSTYQANKELHQINQIDLNTKFENFQSNIPKSP